MKCKYVWDLEWHLPFFQTESSKELVRGSADEVYISL